MEKGTVLLPLGYVKSELQSTFACFDCFSHNASRITLYCDCICEPGNRGDTVVMDHPQSGGGTVRELQKELPRTDVRSQDLQSH